MSLKVYNSYTRKKETFKPLHKGHVGMYVCGPTVSGESHLGHARGFITFDVIYRYLLHLGYKVRYVRNITDAGHFEEEGREAEDKINKKAVVEKLEPMELVQKYTNLFHWAMLQFNNLGPSIEPIATGHIVEQINMIQQIIAEGYAYEINGSVYFDVKKYAASHDYGKLSGRIMEDLLETTRTLEGQDEKRDKADFALWKSAPPEHLMRWKSPWGEGFPGWHIECSAMATKYLGGEFDIHGGGMDLLFPHHESEIAQSTVCNKHTPARYWLHNNMITVGGKKMGKSYNNQITLTQMFSGNHHLLTQAFSPMSIRFFILQSQYRSTLDFSSEALVGAEKGFKRLWEGYQTLRERRKAQETRYQGTHPLSPSLRQGEKRGNAGTSEQSGEDVNAKVLKLIGEFDEFMNDDFGTARVIANMFEIIPVINAVKDGHQPADILEETTWIKLHDAFKLYIEDIFGLKSLTESNAMLNGVMELLIEIRKESRANRNFATSDKIRNQLNSLGIILKDEKDGRMSWGVE